MPSIKAKPEAISGFDIASIFLGVLYPVLDSNGKV